MDIDGIRKRAANHKLTEEEIKQFLERLQDAQCAHPNGSDVYIPTYIIAAIEKECDRIGIPVYKIEANSLSTAASYAQLYQHELCR